MLTYAKCYLFSIERIGIKIRSKQTVPECKIVAHIQFVMMWTSTSSQRLCLFGGDWIEAGELFASLVCCEAPIDAGAGGVSILLPFGDLGFEEVAFADAAVEALTVQHADFNFDHVQPTGVLWRVVELQTVEDAMRLGGGERFIQSAWRMS